MLTGNRGVDLIKFFLKYIQRHGDTPEHEEASRFLNEIAISEADAKMEALGDEGKTGQVGTDPNHIPSSVGGSAPSENTGSTASDPSGGATVV